jgi:hypothetical protein
MTRLTFVRGRRGGFRNARQLGLLRLPSVGDGGGQVKCLVFTVGGTMANAANTNSIELTFGKLKPVI